MSSIDQFKAFAALSPEDQKPYWFDPVPATDDINRELFPPQKAEIVYVADSAHNLSIVEGKIQIRADDDFFIIACLPWKFRHLAIEDIARVLWPNEEALTFRPDTGCHLIEITMP